MEREVKKCIRCIKQKTVPKLSAELVNIVSSQPMELVSIDFFLSLERSKGGYENILVITDYFSRYAQAFPIKNQLAKTTSKMFFENFIVHYGFPFFLMFSHHPRLAVDAYFCIRKPNEPISSKGALCN